MSKVLVWGGIVLGILCFTATVMAEDFGSLGEGTSPVQAASGDGESSSQSFTPSLGALGTYVTGLKDSIVNAWNGEAEQETSQNEEESNGQVLKNSDWISVVVSNPVVGNELDKNIGRAHPDEILPNKTFLYVSPNAPLYKTQQNAQDVAVRDKNGNELWAARSDVWMKVAHGYDSNTVTFPDTAVHVACIVRADKVSTSGQSATGKVSVNPLYRDDEPGHQVPGHSYDEKGVSWSGSLAAQSSDMFAYDGLVKIQVGEGNVELNDAVVRRDFLEKSDNSQEQKSVQFPNVTVGNIFCTKPTYNVNIDNIFVSVTDENNQLALVPYSGIESLTPKEGLVEVKNGNTKIYVDGSKLIHEGDDNFNAYGFPSLNMLKGTSTTAEFSTTDNQFFPVAL